MTLGSVVANDIELCDELFTSAPIDEPDSEFVVKSFKGTSRKISAQDLSKVWKIKVKDAERTLKVVTQLKKHNVDEHLSREFGTNDRMLRYRRIDSLFFTDTFFATGKAVSWRKRNTCCQLFVSDKGFVFVVPTKSKSEFP